MIDWLFHQQHHFANDCAQERRLSFTTGMEFPNAMKSSFFSGKVVSVYLLTDRNDRVKVSSNNGDSIFVT